MQLILRNKTQQPIINLACLTTRFYSENLADSEDSPGLGLFIIQELVRVSGTIIRRRGFSSDVMLAFGTGGKYEKECGTKLKIRFATDSRISGVQKSGFLEIKKVWDKSKKHFCLIL
ncbi:hypothetical protein P7H50_01495 [Enterococcus durans]|uniref:hypothetical protein n=1 Tax=Enterococcus durans TaxID=53345 RepID=UPI0028923160|nr:hypothetical protein [Enterococcus durans]MDT2835586.1 hypothetical protein [Enterococcus durans]